MYPTGDDLTALTVMQRVLASVGRHPDDPAAERLQFCAYQDDQAAQEEFNLLIAPDFKRQRLLNRNAVDWIVAQAEVGEPIRLSPADAESLLIVVNEARMVLGARLGIEEDGWVPEANGGPNHSLIFLLRYLTAYQDELIGALARRL